MAAIAGLPVCEDTFLKAYAPTASSARANGMTILRPSHTFGPGGGIINNLGFVPTFVDRLAAAAPRR